MQGFTSSISQWILGWGSMQYNLRLTGEDIQLQLLREMFFHPFKDHPWISLKNGSILFLLFLETLHFVCPCTLVSSTVVTLNLRQQYFKAQTTLNKIPLFIVTRFVSTESKNDLISYWSLQGNSLSALSASWKRSEHKRTQQQAWSWKRFNDLLKGSLAEQRYKMTQGNKPRTFSWRKATLLPPARFSAFFTLEPVSYYCKAYNIILTV